MTGLSPTERLTLGQITDRDPADMDKALLIQATVSGWPDLPPEMRRGLLDFSHALLWPERAQPGSALPFAVAAEQDG